VTRWLKKALERRTIRAPSVRSNCNFFSVVPSPVNPIVSNSPHLISARLVNLSSPPLPRSGPSPRPRLRLRPSSLPEFEEPEDSLGAKLTAADAPTSGWKLEGKSIRFLKLSEYRGGSLGAGGEILSQTLEVARSFIFAPGAERCAHEAQVLTRSGEYIRTFLRTLTTRTVRAPRRG
jgi:hypothetical protein